MFKEEKRMSNHHKLRIQNMNSSAHKLLTCISSKAWVIIFSGSSKLFRTLLRFAFATLWNRSNKFIDSVVDLHDDDGDDDVRHGGSADRPVKEDDVEKACADTSEATRRRAVRKFMIVEWWCID